MTVPGLRRSIRLALERMRVSFFVGVALVPTLLSVVFPHIESLMPWWLWAAALGGVIGVLMTAAVVSDRRFLRRQGGRLTPLRGITDLDAVTDLVATAHLGKRKAQNVQTLLPMLRNVRKVYLLTGPPQLTADEAQAEADRLLSLAGRSDLKATILANLPLDVSEEAVEALTPKLVAVRELMAQGGRVIVDITGGTTPMSLVTYRAAVQAGLSVTYTSGQPSRPGADTYDFHGLTAVHEPPDTLAQGGS